MITVENATPFSQSRLWQLQRDYFSEAGITAWRSGSVPHYITSNPVVGKTYAELVLALLRDLAARGQEKRRIYLLELGAGHGRLCYHFFKHFEKYYEASAVPLPPFCYILSDFTETNLTFWQTHPRLRPYLSKGWIDFAHFDVEESHEIYLQYANTYIQPQDLAQPLIVIANYLFDTIPQELFLIKDQVISRGSVTLTTKSSTSTLSTAQLIETLEIQYGYEVLQSPLYPQESILNELVEQYRQQLKHTHILFPHIGIRCLERLRQLSQQGLVLLTADKGEHHLSNLDGRLAPQLIKHGSFSLTVNYHAIGQYCTNQAGLTLFPRHQQSSLDLGCLLFLNEAETYRETINSYERFVNDYGPDDYFAIYRIVKTLPLEMLTYRDIMGMVRFSNYDAHLFRKILPRLATLIPSLSDKQRWNLFLAIPRIWDTYYPLGEKGDLADELGDLLLALTFYREAILYFEKSIMIYGAVADTLYKIAVCYCLLGEFELASPLIDELWTNNSENRALQQLIDRFGAALSMTRENAIVA